MEFMWVPSQIIGVTGNEMADKTAGLATEYKTSMDMSVALNGLNRYTTDFNGI